MKNLWIILILILVISGIWWFMAQNGEEPTPTDMSDGLTDTVEELPTAVSAVRAFVAESSNLSEDQVFVSNFAEMEWPDGCLGLATEGEMCTQAIVPGFMVSIQIDGQEYNYRTDSEGNQIRRER